VLLVPLNTGLLGVEAARLLGSLLVGRLWQQTLARASTPPDRRVPISIYVDEAQEFLRLGGELSDALARSRSLGVAWHLAHQYREQLPTEMRAAIDTNARNKIVFGLEAKDAREYAHMAPQLVPEDFIALPRHSVYVNLMHRGEQTGWVSATTLPAPPTCSDPETLMERSQKLYGALPTAMPSMADVPQGANSDPEGETRIGRRRRRTP
jgi:hypothetical protein